MTDGVCRGIVRAMDAGAVTAATAMLCVDGGLSRLKRYAPELAGGLGLHLQLTSGLPCMPAKEIPTLIGPDGRFPKKRKGVGELDPRQVEREWRAQIARMLDAGYAPDHLDSHHHIHRLPGAFEVFCELCRELGVPGRAVDADMDAALRARGVKSLGVCLTDWFGDALTAGGLLAMVEQAFAGSGGQGRFEVMTHPAEVDAELAAVSSYVEGRGHELAALVSAELADGLRSQGISLVRP